MIDPAKLIRDTRRILHLVPYASIRKDMTALCDALETVLEENRVLLDEIKKQEQR